MRIGNAFESAFLKSRTQVVCTVLSSPRAQKQCESKVSAPVLMPNYILESTRLGFRKPTTLDLPFLEAILGNRALTNHPGELPEGIQIASAAASILRYWNDAPYGPCIIELLKTGKAIGVGGLKKIDIGGTAYADLGMMFFKDYHGDGLGFEAGNALLTHGFIKLGLASVVARTTVENKAALRLLEHWGFVQAKGSSIWKLTRSRFQTRNRTNEIGEKLSR